MFCGDAYHILRAEQQNRQGRYLKKDAFLQFSIKNICWGCSLESSREICLHGDSEKYRKSSANYCWIPTLSVPLLASALHKHSQYTLCIVKYQLTDTILCTLNTVLCHNNDSLVKIYSNISYIHIKTSQTLYESMLGILNCMYKRLKWNTVIAKMKWAASWLNQQNGMCIQWRLRSTWASAQSDQSSLSAWRKLGSFATHWAHSEVSDQTGWMPRLIRVFAGRTVTVILFVLSCCGSNVSKRETTENKQQIKGQNLQQLKLLRTECSKTCNNWNFSGRNVLKLATIETSQDGMFLSENKLTTH